jgi:hypothetical protein
MAATAATFFRYGAICIGELECEPMRSIPLLLRTGSDVWCV